MNGRKSMGDLLETMNKVARRAVSGGTGKELSTKATTGRAQAGGDGESRAGGPSAHLQSVCCLGAGNLRRISPKLEKILGYKIMGQLEKPAGLLFIGRIS